MQRFQYADSKEFEPDLTDDEVVIIGFHERKEKESKIDEENASVKRKEEANEADRNCIQVHCASIYFKGRNFREQENSRNLGN